MEIHQLRYFLAVDRFRSFTRAAEHVHVSQPSLSQQIRKLEAELGAPLFDRLGRRIRLTTIGERFREHARRALQDLEEARREVEEVLGSHTGKVAVGVIPTVAPFLLPPVLEACARAYPGFTVTVAEDLTHSLASRLTEGEIDLAVWRLPVEGPGFVSEVLLADRLLLAVPPRHALWRRGRRRVAFREISHDPFLLLKEGHCFRDDVLQLCRSSRAGPHVIFEGGQFDTLVAMVAAGTGVTLLPQMARRHYRSAGIGLMELQPPQPYRTIGVTRLKAKFLTGTVRAFLEILRDCVKRVPQS